ncbi:MAG: DUF2461 domain-containing protein [Nitrosomonadales bacterium]|nr:DUF2461 domain-containing protein [Nitrosomonadales bacterium]
MTTYFTPALFQFLHELKANNTREWFAANKARYEEVARQPMLNFIADLQAEFNKFAPHVLADAKPVGGSMFRINRDTRFSKDKSPYKTSVAAHFRHQGVAKDISAPGFYLHIAAGEIFMGGGLFHPDSQRLHQVRTAIAEHPEKWRKAISGKEFEQHCTFWGESLKRPPQGFAADHPLIEDMKRKNFVVTIPLIPARLCSANFMHEFTDNCRLISPMAGFLSKATEVAW